jgi:hypothetical protein
MALAVEFFATGGSDRGLFVREGPELMAADCRLWRDAMIDLKTPLALGLQSRSSIRGLPTAAPRAVVDEEIACLTPLPFTG